ncbi:MAG: hypothetical protein MPJ24_03920 [Pirellulaceae bacterium]|nr:hypothetical protein [Pirellulaceae bacterium]
MAKAASKKTAPNKTAAIREYLKQNPSHGPNQIAAAVSKKIGVTVTAGYVSTIKFNDARKLKKGPVKAKAATTKNTAPKKPGPKKSAKRKTGPKKTVAKSVAPAPSGDQVTATDLIVAKNFVEKVGDVDKAKSLVKVLELTQLKS